MLLTGIQHASAKNYSSRQLKNNSSNQALKDTQAKSNFGLYNLSNRYGISFGSILHSDEPTIIEHYHEGDGPYTPEEIAYEINRCINFANKTFGNAIHKEWVNEAAGNIAGLSNNALNNLFHGVELMSNSRTNRFGIYHTCNCINSFNKETAEKVLSATYKFDGEDKPYVNSFYLPGILLHGENKKDILDTILSARVKFENGNEQPVIWSKDIPRILKACTPENKKVLEDYLKKASEDKERHSTLLDESEVEELIKQLETYTD